MATTRAATNNNNDNILRNHNTLYNNYYATTGSGRPTDDEGDVDMTAADVYGGDLLDTSGSDEGGGGTRGLLVTSASEFGNFSFKVCVVCGACGVWMCVDVCVCCVLGDAYLLWCLFMYCTV